MRVPFNGVIDGEVTVRPGESESDAVLRAEQAINDILTRYAKRYGRVAFEGRGNGPCVGLEPVE